MNFPMLHDYLSAQLTAVSIVWALHSTFVWEAWKSKRANTRLVAGLFWLTGLGLVSLLGTLLSLLLPALNDLEYPDLSLGSAFASLSFILGVGLYYIALLGRILYRSEP